MLKFILSSIKEFFRQADYSACDGPGRQCLSYIPPKGCALYGMGHKPTGDCPDADYRRPYQPWPEELNEALAEDERIGDLYMNMSVDQIRQHIKSRSVLDDYPTDDERRIIYMLSEHDKLSSSWESIHITPEQHSVTQIPQQSKISLDYIRNDIKKRMNHYNHSAAPTDDEVSIAYLITIIDDLQKANVNLCSVCGNSGRLTPGQSMSCDACEHGNMWSEPEFGEPRERYEYQKQRAEVFYTTLKNIRSEMADGAFQTHDIALQLDTLLSIVDKSKTTVEKGG